MAVTRGINVRIGVIGSRGRLGSELVGRLSAQGFEPVECDITNAESILDALSGKHFDSIVNCAAYTNVDKAEKEELKALAINGFGPENLARVYPGYIVHISSDYIFDGENGPYTEEDETSPISAYGRSKHVGEIGLRPHMDRTLVIRTTILYDNGKQYPNFVTSIINQLQAGKVVSVPKDLLGNPTYIPHLAHAITVAINKGYTGIVNIAGRTRMSRFQCAREVAYMFGFDANNIVGGPVFGDAKRPRKAGFMLDKAKSLDIPLYSYWEGLEHLKKELEIAS